jgi:hypothetical protein
MCLVRPVPNTYIGMQSCIPAMIWWWCGGSATSYPDEVLGSTPQTWLNGLALSHVSRLTLSGVPKILLYCTEYNRPTTEFCVVLWISPDPAQNTHPWRLWYKIYLRSSPLYGQNQRFLHQNLTKFLQSFYKVPTKFLQSFYKSIYKFFSIVSCTIVTGFVGRICSSARIRPCFQDSVDRVRPAESVSWSNTFLLL